MIIFVNFLMKFFNDIIVMIICPDIQKAIDVFMSSCMIFVFFSLMEYALVNVVLGDVPEEERRSMSLKSSKSAEVGSRLTDLFP